MKILQQLAALIWRGVSLFTSDAMDEQEIIPAVFDTIVCLGIGGYEQETKFANNLITNMTIKGEMRRGFFC